MKTSFSHSPPPETFSKNHGIPGFGARARGFSASLTPLIAMVFASGLVFGAILRPAFLQGWKAAVLLLLLAGGLFVTWKRAVIIYLRHEAGARGEEQVARVLNAFPEPWQSFHNVVIGEKETDHVLVGPEHVFCIETVHWNGQVRLVNEKLLHNEQFYPGYDLETLKNRSECIAEALGLPRDALTTMVCIVGGRYGSYPGLQKEVWLGEIQDLGVYLLGEPHAGLLPDTRNRILEILKTKVNS